MSFLGYLVLGATVYVIGTFIHLKKAQTQMSSRGGLYADASCHHRTTFGMLCGDVWGIFVDGAVFTGS